MQTRVVFLSKNKGRESLSTVPLIFHTSQLLTCTPEWFQPVPASTLLGSMHTQLGKVCASTCTQNTVCMNRPCIRFASQHLIQSSNMILSGFAFVDLSNMSSQIYRIIQVERHCWRASSLASYSKQTSKLAEMAQIHL